MSAMTILYIVLPPCARGTRGFRFSKTGRHWLAQQPLPADERRSVDALGRQLDFHGDELALVDREIANEVLTDPAVARLMTSPGIDAIVAMSIAAAVGDFQRFPSPDKLVSYMGLNPKVRQSGDAPASHGRISKAAHTRGMLVEAAWTASRAPGPLRAFYRRIRARRGFQVAVVATARKMTVPCWHLVTKDQNYVCSRPSLNAHKRRKLELTAGAPRALPRRGAGYHYNDKAYRQTERTLVEQAERSYDVFVANWEPRCPAATT